MLTRPCPTAWPPRVASLTVPAPPGLPSRANQFSVCAVLLHGATAWTECLNVLTRRTITLDLAYRPPRPTPPQLHPIPIYCLRFCPRWKLLPLSPPLRLQVQSSDSGSANRPRRRVNNTFQICLADTNRIQILCCMVPLNA